MNFRYQIASKALAALLLAQAALLAPAFAEDTTCLIEGTMLVDEKPVAARDCFENVGASLEDFKRVCDAVEQTAIAVTKSVGTPPPTTIHGKSCPVGAVAKCKGFLFMPVLHHIYKRTDHEMEVARESCLTQNGEWSTQ